MLVNTKNILQEAKKGGYAVGAFNLLSHPDRRSYFKCRRRNECACDRSD